MMITSLLRAMGVSIDAEDIGRRIEELKVMAPEFIRRADAVLMSIDARLSRMEKALNLAPITNTELLEPHNDGTRTIGNGVATAVNGRDSSDTAVTGN
jgi:hypothetical protein